jgi:hypothetical protein
MTTQEETKSKKQQVCEEALIKALRKRDTKEEKKMLRRQPEKKAGDGNFDIKIEIYFKENEELIKRLTIEYEIESLEDDIKELGIDRYNTNELKLKKQELLNEVVFGYSREKLEDMPELRNLESIII